MPVVGEILFAHSDLPPIAEAALELLNNTDDIEAYLPMELQ